MSILLPRMILTIFSQHRSLWGSEGSERGNDGNLQADHARRRVGPDNKKVALLKRLEVEGIAATAKVTDKYVEEYLSHDTSGSGPRRASVARAIRMLNDDERRAEVATVNYNHFVNIEFKTDLGQTVRAKSEIPGEFYEGLRSGEIVPIIYHPADPEHVNRLTDHSFPYRDLSEIYRIMAMFTLCIAAMLVWHGRPRRTDQIEGIEEAAAGSRISSFREARTVGSDPSPRRVASARPTGAPKGFGRPVRTRRT